LISGTLQLDSNLGPRNGPFLVVDSREVATLTRVTLVGRTEARTAINLT
jgi:hypothetical protein